MSSNNSGDSQVLTLPDGSNVDSSEIGSEYVVGQSGQMPTTEIVDFNDADKELRERDKYVAKQPLVRAFEENADLIDIIDLTLKEIAEDIAHIKFERRKAIRNGERSTQYTVAKIASLKSLTDSLMKRKLSFEDSALDFDSPKMQKLFRLWMEFFHHCMGQSGISQSDIDLVFGQIQSDLPEWEQRMVDELKAQIS